MKKRIIALLVSLWPVDIFYFGGTAKKQIIALLVSLWPVDIFYFGGTALVSAGAAYWHPSLPWIAWGVSLLWLAHKGAKK